MLIQLNQAEIEEALRVFLNDQCCINTEDRTVTISFSQRRQPTSEFIADVDITTVQDVSPAEPPPEKAPKATRKPRASKEEKSAETPAPKPSLVDTTPAAEVTNPDKDPSPPPWEGVQTVDQETAEPEAKEEEAPAPSGKVSLFS